ncbi:MAG: cell wall-binding repeat-containing protein [Parcubacteria group bacterium]
MAAFILANVLIQNKPRSSVGQVTGGGPFTFVEDFESSLYEDINYTSANWDKSAHKLSLPKDTHNARKTYRTKALAQSLDVDIVSNDITSATLTAEQKLNGGSIDFYLSNNANDFELVQPGEAHTFKAAGSHLRWKAELANSSTDLAISPLIEKITIVYSAKIGDQVVHIDGVDPANLAVEVSKTLFPGAGQARAVLLSRDNEVIDAFVGNPLAKIAKAPLLFTDSDQLLPVTAQEIERVLGDKAKTIYVLGREQAVSNTVLNELATQGYTNIARLGGATRFETAEEIAAEIKRHSPDPVSKVFLTEARYLVDAFAVAPIANYILINERGAAELNASTDRFIKSQNSLVDLEIIGGSEALPNELEQNIKDNLPGLKVVRTAGSDRFDTSVKIAAQHFKSAKVAVLANGRPKPNSPTGFFATLLAGQVAIEHQAPLLLVETDVLPTVISSFLKEHAQNLETAFVVGTINDKRETIFEQISNLI